LVFKYLKKIEKRRRFNTLIPLGVWIVLISNKDVEEKMPKNVKRKTIVPYQSAIVNVYIMYLVDSHIISHHHTNIVYKIIFKPKSKSFPSSMKEDIYIASHVCYLQKSLMNAKEIMDTWIY
jgi:hypothetical protein